MLLVANSVSLKAALIVNDDDDILEKMSLAVRYDDSKKDSRDKNNYNENVLYFDKNVIGKKLIEIESYIKKIDNSFCHEFCIMRKDRFGNMLELGYCDILPPLSVKTL